MCIPVHISLEVCVAPQIWRLVLGVSAIPLPSSLMHFNNGLKFKEVFGLVSQCTEHIMQGSTAGVGGEGYNLRQ